MRFRTSVLSISLFVAGFFSISSNAETGGDPYLSPEGNMVNIRLSTVGTVSGAVGSGNGGDIAWVETSSGSIQILRRNSYGENELVATTQGFLKDTVQANSFLPVNDNGDVAWYLNQPITKLWNTYVNTALANSESSPSRVFGGSDKLRGGPVSLDS